jgi:phosphate-selective porin
MPFAGADDSPFKSLRIGVAGTVGDVDSASLATAGDQVTSELGITFLDATAGSFDGIRTRLGFEICWTLGSFTARGEFIRRTDQIDVGALDGEEIASTGWSFAVCWILTGESRALEGRLAPARPLFDDGGFGAIEVAVRVSQLEIDDEIFAIGVAPAAGNSPSALVYTFGVNWQVHRTIRVMADLILETFEDEVTFSNGDQEDQFIGALVRWQLDF